MALHPLQKISLFLKQHAIFIGPLLAAVVGYTLYFYGWHFAGCVAGATATLCAVWWIFEPIPIPATSLIPLCIFPLTGVLTGAQVAAAYGHPLILLFLGGSLLSKAMEKTGTHQQLALGTVKIIGGNSSRRIVFGFMIASAFLSMWISNTATALMLLPIVLAVLEKAEDKKLAIPLLLGVAYGASIGGMGTHIGSPPNLVFMSNYQQFTGEQLTLVDWMTWGIPIVLIFLPIAGFWLTRNLNSSGKIEIPDPGKWTTAQKRVVFIFALTAIGWITRGNPFGGWQGLLNIPTANDAAVAFLGVLLLFLIPDGKKETVVDNNGSYQRQSRLLDWEHAIKIPWGIFILFAGGLALASAFTATGISDALGNTLGGLSSFHPFIMIFIICILVTFLTEVTSNTATSTMLMPVLAAAGAGAGIDPKLLMVPAALSASCAFMLPVATPPNVIVFSAEKISIQEMAKEGIVLNLIGTVIISSMVYFILA